MRDETILIEVKERRGTQGLCSQCRKSASTYDHLGKRYFRFIPLWGCLVQLAYNTRRVSCPEHGVKVEHLPWAEGKSPLCEPFKIFLAHWAKYLSWLEVARQFRVSWKNVFTSVEHVVEYGLKHRNVDNVKSIGIDETQYLVGHKYLTLVYQIDSSCRRLLFVGRNKISKNIAAVFSPFWERTMQTITSDLQ